jgi:hypothetical protein
VSFTVVFDDGSAKYYGPTLVEEGPPARTSIPSSGSPIVKVFSNSEAFAAIRQDGTISTWGNAAKGGDSSAISGALSSQNPVTNIFSNAHAFAALRQDGSVVTWGDPQNGGNSSLVAALLNGDIDVVSVVGTKEAFAAIRADGSVVTWGRAGAGGDSAAVAGSLNGTIDVTKVFSTWGAFAALRTDGSVITWGDADSGGNSSTVATQLNGTDRVTTIASTANAFAALRTSGTVVTWGSSAYGGDSTAVQSDLKNIAKIFSTEGAFAALRTGGTAVITWGNQYFGGNSTYYSLNADGSPVPFAEAAVTIADVPVLDIHSTIGAFLAVRQDGSIRTWGQSFYGAQRPALTPTGALGTAIAGVLETGFGFLVGFDGKTLRWNNLDGGFESGGLTSSFGCDMSCKATKGALVGLSSDGKLQTIGSPNYGADPDIYAKLVAIAKGSYTLSGPPQTTLPSICLTFQPDALSRESSGTCYSDDRLTRWLNAVGFTKVWSNPRDYLNAIKLNPDDTINVQQTQAAIDAVTSAAQSAVQPSNPLAATANPPASYTSIGSTCSTCGNLLGEINKISIIGGFGPIF